MNIRSKALSTLLVLSSQIRLSMSWRSSGNSNAELVTNMKKNGLFSSNRVGEAMLAVDRGDFTNNNPYEDRPQTIGFNATISAPHMHAAALEALKDHFVAGANALDVGSGSGFLAACMAQMVGPNRTVVGIEHIPQLVEMSKKNVAKHHRNLLENQNLILVEGDGRLGYPSKAPYMAIHVGAAAKEIPPQLIEQLAEGGRMVIPVEKSVGEQYFLQVEKVNGQVRQKAIESVIYVPLTSREKQLGIE
ncbi:unnamed protein product [Caenorhabditis auriculariae]|uniref:protein-L-isoaspartate(D-aspartate) O-methyltransferase n=1 Tax=Caenorhabditis auriculariae TaxID=2777116 RepID=A0A8S1HIH9_9PELO|nr:unnamed protein product [Caenorhabditis auriculariae]